MPSYIPKNKETVAVYFDREYPNGRITQDPLPIFGIVKNRKRGTTKFNDGELKDNPNFYTVKRMKELNLHK